MDLSQFKKKFIDEAESLLTKLDNILIELEKDPKQKQFIDEAFRIMHTIKGASGMYGFEKVVETTHEMEALFAMARDGSITISQPIIDITFASADHIKALLIDENCEKPGNIQRHAVIFEGINSIKNSLDKPVENAKPVIQPTYEKSKTVTWNIIFYPNDDLIKRAVNLVYTFQDLFALGEYKINSTPFDSEQGQYWSIFLVTDQTYDDIEGALMFIMDYCKITKIADFNIFNASEFNKRVEYIKELSDIDKEEYAQQPENNDDIAENKTTEILSNINAIKDTATTSAFKNTTNRINVDASKLDHLMYLVSELVTTKSELLLALQKQNELKAFDAAEKIEKLSKLFSENALSIRLVSLQEMLNKFKRLIRDLSKQLGKEIEFITVGEDTELDKNIIDSIGEPIMHLIRNCIDHGIEIPKKRVERGKPTKGTIRFEAQKSGNFVFIDICDDGNGINTDYVYKKAVDKGFIAQGTQLSEKEINDLIFLPGFSTAESLSNVSGRGIGMDIVLKKIHEIRGEISVTSVKGSGTTFNMKLQQTISIIDTLLISAGNITYAIPVEDVESCDLEAHENLIDRQNNLIDHNNELMPFLNLRERFSTTTAPFTGDTEKIIIIKKQSRRYAIVTDAIIGEFQAVIKPLGKTFNETKFISGASLLGDGSIAILLDTDKLWYELSNN